MTPWPARRSYFTLLSLVKQCAISAAPRVAVNAPGSARLDGTVSELPNGSDQKKIPPRWSVTTALQAAANHLTWMNLASGALDFHQYGCGYMPS